MKTNDKRTVLKSLLNGESKPLEQLKAAERMASIPSVFISMPDGTLDVGNSKAFSSRFVTKEELKRVLAQTGESRTIFILPNNGRNDRIL